MHYAKYGKAAVGSILMHSDRGINGPDTHEHSNESIDRSRTHLNYDLKDRSGLTAYAYYKERIEKIAEETKQRTGKSIRKDAVTLCSWAVTVPKDLPEDKHADFFNAVYKWFSDRYGEDNIVTAAVHMDETTPHMHLQFTPIIEKKGIRKLCAKECETKHTLGKVHQELQKYLVQELGCDVNILNGATDQGNKTVLQLQVGSLQEQVAAAEERVKAAEHTLIQAQQELQKVQQTTERSKEKAWSRWADEKMSAYTLFDEKLSDVLVSINEIFKKNAIGFSMSKDELQKLINKVEKILKKAKDITYKSEHFAFETQDYNQKLNKAIDELSSENQRLQKRITSLEGAERKLKRIERAIDTMGLSDRVDQTAQRLEQLDHDQEINRQQQRKQRKKRDDFSL